MKNKEHFFRKTFSRFGSSFFFMLFIVCNFSFAQKVSVKGKVISSSDNQEIIGASVRVIGTSIGTITDIEGNFSLSNIPPKSVLEFSYIGFKTQKSVVVANKFYNIKLQEDTKVLDEVVVVGYGNLRKKELAGAVARVESEDLTKINTSDIGTAIQGQIAGVNVQASSGQPGSTANIQIRGISSINGSNNPLYVVDGVPYEGDPGLSPQEIESLDVLKDAASAAIYGTRGAGGVILITTKAGKEGEMKVSVDANYGMQKITSGLNLVNASQKIYLSALFSANGEQIAPNQVWNALWQNTNLFTNDSKIINAIEQDNQPMSNISLTMSGGSKNLTYNVIGNYYKQDGILINSGYERYNFRVNSTFKKKRWTLNTNISAKLDKQDSPAWGTYQQIYNYSPNSVVVDPNQDIGSVGGDDNQKLAFGNLMAKFKETNVNKGKSFNLNFSATYDILKNLSFNSRVGTGYSVNDITKTNPLFRVYGDDGKEIKNPNTRSGIRKTSQTNTNLLWENMLNYNLKLGKHDFKFTGVLSMEKYTFESFFADKKDLLSNDVISIGAATGESLVGVGTGVWGQDRTSTLVGMLGRLQYNYADRYMFSASIRKDGSSRFAKDNRWGYFPSASVAWNISEEKFWNSLKKTINSFKLRASYGTTGNQNFGDYTSASTISPLYDYAFVGATGGVLNLGSTQTAYSNVDVKWETSEQTNLGLDLSFLNNKLTFSSDFYLTNKKNMLFPLKIPPIAGTGTNGSVVLNVGDMENKGMEYSLKWRDKIVGINYRAGITYSRNLNKITKMAGSNKRSPLGAINTLNGNDNITFLCEGMEAGVFLMMPTNGIINTDEKLMEYQKIRPDAKLGDLMYVDINKDGKFDDDDRVNCGSGAPEAEVGFNFGADWKGFDFSMNWYASIGNEIVNGSKVASYQSNMNRDMTYQWSWDNQISTIPSYRTGSHFNARSYADIWVEDGSFVRLKNIVLGYSMPRMLISKFGLTKLRFYLAADNLLTFTKYDGYDPEVGNNGLSTRGLDMGTYPIGIQMRGGIQIDF